MGIDRSEELTITLGEVIGDRTDKGVVIMKQE
jgi:hypothetical protein